MLASSSVKSPYLADFESFQGSVGARAPEWLRKLRTAAALHFSEVGFPTTELEDWKYTNVAQIAEAVFPPAFRHMPGKIVNMDMASFTFDESKWSHIVFLNGVYAPELSSLQGLPRGVYVGSLDEAVAIDSGLVEKHLGRYASYQDNAFMALNTAFLNDGCLVYIPEGVSIEQPIHILYIAAAGGNGIACHPRNLIIAGKNSSMTVVERYVSLFDTRHFTNAVTEIVSGEGSTIKHYKLQRESDKAFHVGTTQVYQIGRASCRERV